MLKLYIEEAWSETSEPFLPIHNALLLEKCWGTGLILNGSYSEKYYGLHQPHWPKNLERTFVLVSSGLVSICSNICPVRVHTPLSFFLQGLSLIYVLCSRGNPSHDHTKSSPVVCTKTSGSKMSWLGRQQGKLWWHHWVMSLWLVVVAVNASALQPTAQLLF